MTALQILLLRGIFHQSEGDGKRINNKNCIIFFSAVPTVAYKMTDIGLLNFSTKSFRHLGTQCSMFYKAVAFTKDNKIQEIWVTILQSLSESSQ